jgi:hypothetical protein
MKTEQDNRLEAGGDLSEPTQRARKRLKPPQIVGEVANPVLEAARRLCWRAFDGGCNCFVLIRLSIHDRIYGPEPPTPDDLKHEADHKRLVRAFSAAANVKNVGK